MIRFLLCLLFAIVATCGLMVDSAQAGGFLRQSLVIRQPSRIVVRQPFVVQPQAFVVAPQRFVFQPQQVIVPQQQIFGQRLRIVCEELFGQLRIGLNAAHAAPGQAGLPGSRVRALEHGLQCGDQLFATPAGRARPGAG